MRWGVVGKGSIHHVQQEADSLVDALLARDQDVVLSSDLAARQDVPSLPLAQMNDAVDLFLTVGGDGTILHAQQHAEKPVFGVNAGAIGFLAEVEPPMAEEGIDRILEGKYTIDERRTLATTLDDRPLADAVNEVTLQTSRIAKLIRFHVHVDGHLLDTFRGDGFIVSTATGSTGYAMSVGGPLVHPRVPGIVLAPIAPFKLASRPWVVPSDANVEVTLLPRDSAQGAQQARVVVDGQHGWDVETGSVLRIRESGRKARFVRLGGGFYERVRTKLMR